MKQPRARNEMNNEKYDWVVMKYPRARNEMSNEKLKIGLGGYEIAPGKE